MIGDQQTIVSFSPKVPQMGKSTTYWLVAQAKKRKLKHKTKRKKKTVKMS